MPLGARKVLTEPRHILVGAPDLPGRGRLGQVRVGGALPADGRLGPWPDSTTVASSSGRHTRRQRLEHLGRRAAGQVGASDGAGEQQVAGEQHRRDRPRSRASRTSPTPWCGPGACATVSSSPASASAAPSASSLTSSGSPTVSSPSQRHADATAAERLLGVAEHVRGPRGGSRRGRRARRRPGDRGDVVDVAVGEDDRDGLEPVLRERVLDALGGLVARVDDHALLAGGGGDHVTVGAPGPGGEPGNEHDRPSWWRTGGAAYGAGARGSEPTGAAGFLSEPIYGTGHTQAVGSQDARVPLDVRDARGETRWSAQEQRRRQLAREKFLRQQQRAHSRAPQGAVRNAVIASVARRGRRGQSALRTRPGSSRATTTRPTRAPRSTPSAVADGKAPDPCEKPAAGKVEDAARWKKEPAMTIDKSAQVHHEAGRRPAATSTIALKTAAAPHTVELVRLPRGQGLLRPHQVPPAHHTGIYVLQCGDPTGTGSGGPGYTIPDENLKDTAPRATSTRRGTIAMANTGQAHTGGSQFFLVYKDSQLPPELHTVRHDLRAA